MKAIWKNTVLAECNDTIIIENNHYFPLTAIKKKYFIPSNTQTNCPWKGIARYYTVQVVNEQNPDAAWFYPEPKPAAQEIKNYVAFWKGVKVTE